MTTGAPVQEQLLAQGLDRAAAAAAFGDVSESDFELEADVPKAASGSSEPSLAQVMASILQLMTMLAKKDEKTSSHLANAKLEIKNFSRIKTFTNKHETWNEWKNQFTYAIMECDVSFSDFLSGLEKRADKIDEVSDLNPTQNQLSAILFSRLIAVTTGTANTMVMSAKGNGGEAWRLLNKTCDPQTDQRLTKVIMDIVNFKIKGKDVQGGIIEWEQVLSSLETDHHEKLSPKMARAFLMNVLPKMDER